MSRWHRGNDTPSRYYDNDGRPSYGLNVPDLSWQRDAACRLHPHLNFLDPGPWGTAACKAICAVCPVRPECLALHMAAEAPGHRHFVAGGLTAAERATLARQDTAA